MNARHVSLTAALLGLLVTAAPSMAQSQPTKVGVVNMGKVFNTMQETKDIKTQLEASQSQLNATVNAHKADLEKMRSDLQNGPKPDTQQYDDLAGQFERKTVEYDNEIKLKQIDIARSQSKQLKAIFDKIEATVGDVAKEKQLDLVITMVKPEFPANVRDLNPDAISQLINQRNVMYVNDKIDITSDVITRLDAKYKSGGSTPAPPPAAGK
jgi:Skp family chaperone for outer membrane proteins